MKYKLITDKQEIIFDPVTMTIDVPFERHKYTYDTTYFKNKAPEEPSKHCIETFKLLLGLHCNYHCKYCNQAPVKEIIFFNFSAINLNFPNFFFSIYIVNYFSISYL